MATVLSLCVYYLLKKLDVVAKMRVALLYLTAIMKEML
ncbi:hypothetical protein CGCSCA1_v014802 [Colletotrichum siamense]|nr:hypothetical protein CGCSCA1_v014802 [Colletotrichum siamense]